MTKETVVDSNRRIARNTFFLYFRMLLTTGVSLYTIKAVLKTLGVVDFGIYNVVGSIVTMFSFLSGTMSSASQRFFAFELGRNDLEKLKKTFSMTMTIYFLIALIIFLLAETIGLWFFETQLSIPLERRDAARWVYQFSMFSFMMSMLTVPFNAVIIAHEKMKVYAFVSIIEVLLKLLIVYFLTWFEYDKLKLYSILTFIVVSIVTFIYRNYCKRKFEECSFVFYWDKGLFKEITSYSGWNLFGAISGVGRDQGINILLNMFFGPVVNAARGVSYQVNSLILNFGHNFYAAVRPQITKSYAANQFDDAMRLVFQSTKFSFYLLLLLSLPLLLETRFFLSLWLVDVPSYTTVFVRLTIIDALLRLVVNPIVTLAQASGKVKIYQIIVGGMGILSLPVAYILLYLGFNPQSSFYVLIINTFFCNVFRVIILKYLVNFDIKKYFIKVLLVIFNVGFFSFVIPRVVQMFWIDESMLRSISIIVLGLFTSLVAILMLGLTKNEFKFFYTKLMKILNKKHALV